MLTYEEAREIARHYLEAQGRSEAEVQDRLTLRVRAGWVFFYESKQYLVTGDARDRLAGNGPIFVRESDGELVELSSAVSVEEQLASLGLAP